MRAKRHFLGRYCLCRSPIQESEQKSMSMTPPWVDAQAPSTRLPPDELAAPLLALSSAKAGWEELGVEVYHEPRVAESWSVPANPDIILGLYAGGPIHVERRQAQGSWKGGD